VDEAGAVRLACTFESAEVGRPIHLQWREGKVRSRCSGIEVVLTNYGFSFGAGHRPAFAAVRERCGSHGTVDRLRPLRRIAVSTTGGYAVPLLSVCERIRDDGKCRYESEYWEAVLDSPSPGSPPCMVGESHATPYGCVTTPILDLMTSPAYPVDALRHGVRESFVILETLIDATGGATDVRVLEAAHTGLGFGRAARDVVAEWLYQPARLDGRPVAMYWVVQVDFAID
jgi:TonB family protein